jgi:hypothetical protein
MLDLELADFVFMGLRRAARNEEAQGRAAQQGAARQQKITPLDRHCSSPLKAPADTPA